MEEPLNFYKKRKIVFGDSQYADVKFIFDESPDILYAHAAVLCVECPKLFENMANGKMHGSCIVSVKDIPMNIFKDFLEMLYLGGMNKHLENYGRLLELSIKYEVSVEKNALEVLQKISLNNVLFILHLLYDSEKDFIEEMKIVLNFINKNFKAVLGLDEVMFCSKGVLTEILKVEEISDDYFLSESEVADVVERYVIVNGNPELVGHEKGEQFREIIKLVRFPTMTPIEFTNCVRKCTHLLSEREKIEIFERFVLGKIVNLEYSNFVRRIFVLKNFEPREHESNIWGSNIWGIGKARQYPICQDIPKIPTIFSVNCPVVIRGVSIYTVGTPLNVNVSLKIESSKIIASAKGTINVFDHSRNVYYNRCHMYMLEPLVVLRPNRKYTLEIKYEKEDSIHLFHSECRYEFPLKTAKGMVFYQLSDMISEFDTIQYDIDKYPKL